MGKFECVTGLEMPRHIKEGKQNKRKLWLLGHIVIFMILPTFIIHVYSNGNCKAFFVHFCKPQCNSFILCLSLQPMKVSGRVVWLYSHFSPTIQGLSASPASRCLHLLVSNLAANYRLVYPTFPYAWWFMMYDVPFFLPVNSSVRSSPFLPLVR